MPVLFAATLFVSASLLFMVQPMVAKMVLPLLGGSPAVWNACMVFFQALLLLGYLYSHHISGKYSARKQWTIHLLVLGLPLAAFFLAVSLGTRHSPIAIVESLAPGEGSSPVLRVLMLLTIAIGVPFLVVSTSAPLLQKWFTCTGHPSSRDPYFLYAASNFGSMISLLGYPLFIEPNLTIVGQEWVFAIGFAILAALIAVCGYAAANPLAVPPSSLNYPAGKQSGKGSQGKLPRTELEKASAQLRKQVDSARTADPPASEAPPSLARKLKWIALAFVPSSMMLGVTFHMTTDIASVPLLWVGPLALYLVTFIIAFGRVPDWFRLVIGNLAPVMILLLVFVMLSGVNPGFAVHILLYLATFFAAALMCHYELARDRPSPQYLTGFFLLMSVGGVLGGIFNSLVAPVVFPYDYEFPLILTIACLLVPRLNDMTGSDEDKAKEKAAADSKMKQAAGAGMDNVVVVGVGMGVVGVVVGVVICIFVGVVVGVVAGVIVGVFGIGFGVGVAGDAADLSAEQQQKVKRVRTLCFDIGFPLLMGLFFYGLRQLPYTETFVNMRTSISDAIKLSAETIQVIFIYAIPVMLCFFFVDRPVRFALCVAAILGYATYADSGRNLFMSDRSFFGILKVERYASEQRPMFHRTKPNGELEYVTSGRIVFNRLVHGTTLHGTQISEMDNNVFDMFQAMTAFNPLENYLIAEANHRFNPREEPLTYYHRSGPVGAMFHELRTRKGGVDAKADVAMVGLGTGSVSCYALPGQRLTFYEIDWAVRNMVEKPTHVMNEDEIKKDPNVKKVMGPFTYVADAQNRGATVDFQMGDARLRLKDNVDRKYALLLVDAFSSDSIPIHLLTTEAVQLYFDRMTEDGILALHISNKYVKLEPVVAAIAKELGVTARVWNDDKERGPGKTASSWVALARTPEHLGSLYSNLGDLVFKPTAAPGEDDRMRKLNMDSQVWEAVFWDYPDELREGQPKSKYETMNKADNPKKEWLEWIAARLEKEKDPVMQARLVLYARLIQKYDESVTFQDAMMHWHGHAFRRLETYTEVHAWTDDYSDVMRVMMIPEIQAIRKFFGLPTPIER